MVKVWLAYDGSRRGSSHTYIYIYMFDSSWPCPVATVGIIIYCMSSGHGLATRTGLHFLRTVD